MEKNSTNSKPSTKQSKYIELSCTR